MPGIGISISPFLRKKSENKYFTITIDTTKAGSANDTFVLPLPGSGTYDYYVDWGEGGAEEHFVVNTSQTHVYASSGTYQIKIRGTFPQIYFNTVGDRLKLISIDNWGIITWGSFENAYYGCSNMNCVAIDYPDTSEVITFFRAFSNCSSLITLDVSGFDTSSATSYYRMLYGCSLFKGSLASLNMTAALTTTQMCTGCNINDEGTINYDATLMGWAAQTVAHNLVFDAGTSKYSAVGGGTAARAILTNAPNNWTISDGGAI